MPYRFQNPQSPYTLAIADLLRSQNEPLAQAALAKGQIKGQTLQSLGQQVGQFPGKVQALKLADAEEGLRRAQTQRFTDEADARKGEAQLNEFISAGLAQAQTVDQETGLKIWDRGKVQSLLASVGAADRWKDYAPLLDAADADLKAKHVASQSYLANTAKLAAQTGYNRPFFEQSLQMAVENGTILPSDAKQVMDAVNANPANLKQIVDEKAGIKTPEDYTLNTGDTRFKGGTNEQIATGTPKADTPPAVGSFEDYVVRAYGQTPTPEQIIKARADYAIADNAASKLDTTGKLSQEGLDAAALMYAKTGQLPALGMGAAELRKDIINRAAQLMPDLDLATNQAAFRSNQASLLAIQKQRDALSAFESTGLKNLDIFLETAKKITDTGSPFLNTPLRSIQERGLGDADLTAFNTARRVVIPEFAKLLANPGLSGVLTDTARHEVEQVMSGSATGKQIIATANILKQDAKNRRDAYDAQIATIRDRIKGMTAADAPPPPNPNAPPVRRFNAATGKLE